MILRFLRKLSGVFLYLGVVRTQDTRRRFTAKRIELGWKRTLDLKFRKLVPIHGDVSTAHRGLQGGVGDLAGRAIAVLIVEPSGFYASHMASLLTEHSCGCEVVKTIAEAKVALCRSEWQMICISRRLDDGTGPELAKFIRQEPGMGRIPLLMVTSEESQEAFAEAYAAGFTEVFFRGELQRLGRYLELFASSRQEDRRLVGRILYLEDTKWLAAVTIGILHGVGLAVDHFTAVGPALDAFEAKDFDMVITDIVLEGAESGLSLVQAIRRMEGPQASVPILAMTGIEDATRRIELFRAGVSDYLAKPVITEELVARVSNLIINKQLLETVQRQQDQLMRMATVDALTGLYNRRHLTSMMAAAVAKAQAEGSSLSIFLLDLDHFKKINDRFGHQSGDVVLETVGAVLREFSEEIGASACRFGGEEFLLLLEGTSWQKALEHAETLRSLVEQSKPDGRDVTVSVGVSKLGADETDYELLRRADQALYLAKERGRNQVCGGSPVPADSQKCAENSPQEC